MPAAFGDLETDGDFVVFDVDGDVVMSQDVGDSSVNRPGFDGGSDDMEGSLSWDRRSTPMSCASEPRG